MSPSKNAWLRSVGLLGLFGLFGSCGTAYAQGMSRVERLIAAYPAHLERVETGVLIWKDGTRMPLGGGQASRDHEAMLADATIADMLAQTYQRGALVVAPARDWDPGRARNAAFFQKMYGDCVTGGVAGKVATIAWLPKKGGKPLQVTTINSVHEKLAAVSAALDQLPASFDPFLLPAAGTYVCRPIAGTTRVSAHGYGIAIDISAATTDYWLWNKPKAAGVSSSSAPIAYKNRVPYEIVQIFEQHGFIWGGKWYHYDTMHFEYRPELLD